MSEFSNTDHDELAEKIADRLVSKLTDEAVVAQITDAWSGQFDRHIGRAVRRVLYLLGTGLVIFLGLKLESVMGWFRTH
jgi:hypothetical protein